LATSILAGSVGGEPQLTAIVIPEDRFRAPISTDGRSRPDPKEPVANFRSSDRSTCSCRPLSSSQNRCSATAVIRESLRRPGRRTAAFKTRDLRSRPTAVSRLFCRVPHSRHRHRRLQSAWATPISRRLISTIRERQCLNSPTPKAAYYPFLSLLLRRQLPDGSVAVDDIQISLAIDCNASGLEERGIRTDPVL
jgi:hypothetical protein